MTDGYTSMDTGLARPRPGDVSVCLYCSQINVFSTNADGPTIRPANRDEARMLLMDPKVRAAIRATFDVRRQQ